MLIGTFIVLVAIIQVIINRSCGCIVKVVSGYIVLESL